MVVVATELEEREEGVVVELVDTVLELALVSVFDAMYAGGGGEVIVFVFLAVLSDCGDEVGVEEELVWFLGLAGD